MNIGPGNQGFESWLLNRDGCRQETGLNLSKFLFRTC